MCVLLLDILIDVMVQIGCQTFIIEKNWRSPNFNFLGDKIWRNALTLETKKIQDIIWVMFILGLSSSAAFCLQKSVSDFF